MVNSMSCIIDFEQSSEQDKFIVKSGFIPELDESKVTRNVYMDLLTHYKPNLFL